MPDKARDDRFAWLRGDPRVENVMTSAGVPKDRSTSRTAFVVAEYSIFIRPDLLQQFWQVMADRLAVDVAVPLIEPARVDVVTVDVDLEQFAAALSDHGLGGQE